MLAAWAQRSDDMSIWMRGQIGLGLPVGFRGLSSGAIDGDLL